jgi:transcriptional regulator with XRE-family HTH domain
MENVSLLSAGKNLRKLREKLGLTMRDVETYSDRIAERYRNDEFSIPPAVSPISKPEA